jgi:hypothetical protein
MTTKRRASSLGARSLCSPRRRLAPDELFGILVSRQLMIATPRVRSGRGSPRSRTVEAVVSMIHQIATPSDGAAPLDEQP